MSSSGTAGPAEGGDAGVHVAAGDSGGQKRHSPAYSCAFCCAQFNTKEDAEKHGRCEMQARLSLSPRPVTPVPAAAGAEVSVPPRITPDQTSFGGPTHYSSLRSGTEAPPENAPDGVDSNLSEGPAPAPASTGQEAVLIE